MCVQRGKGGTGGDGAVKDRPGLAIIPRLMAIDGRGQGRVTEQGSRAISMVSVLRHLCMPDDYAKSAFSGEIFLKAPHGLVKCQGSNWLDVQDQPHRGVTFRQVIKHSWASL